MKKVVYQLKNEYKRIPEVKAITLAGSGANGRKDNYSDIDIDIIVSKEIDNDRRTQIIKKVSDYMEVGNDYWGDGEGGEKSYWLVADKTTVVLVNATDLFALLQVASFSCIY